MKMVYVPFWIRSLETGTLLASGGQIDTGAWTNLFHADLADLLGIYALESGEPKEFQGIGAGTTMAYGHPVEIIIGDDSKRTYNFNTSVYFSDKVVKATRLLGLTGFLDHFILKLDFSSGTFSLQPFK